MRYCLMLYSNAEDNDLQRRDAIIVKIVFYDQKLKKKKKSETIIECRQSLHFKLLLPRVIKLVHPS